jgi:hypothetical protein
MSDAALAHDRLVALTELALAADDFIASSPMYSQVTQVDQFNRQARTYARLMRALNAARAAGASLPPAPVR